MKEHRRCRLFHTSENSDERTEIGGAITRMRIGAVNGSLHTIHVTPVSTEEMKEEMWEDSFVSLQVADRMVYLDQDEVDAMIELLEMARMRSSRNFVLAGMP